MIRTRSLFAALSLLPLAISACASSEAAPSQTAKTQPASASVPAEAQQLCIETMTKNRTCTDEYIPSLVDTRAKLDKPPDIGEKVEADRAGVIAQAKAEWAQNSKDENIARQCQAMGGEHQDRRLHAVPPERPDHPRAILPGQHVIEEDHAERAVAAPGVARRTVEGDLDLESFLQEPLLQKPRDLGIIFDDE